MSDVWIAIAIGVAVPVALLLGPYLPYLLPRPSDFRRWRAVDYEQVGREFTDGMSRGLRDDRG